MCSFERVWAVLRDRTSRSMTYLQVADKFILFRGLALARCLQAKFRTRDSRFAAMNCMVFVCICIHFANRTALPKGGLCFVAEGPPCTCCVLAVRRIYNSQPLRWLCLFVSSILLVLFLEYHPVSYRGKLEAYKNDTFPSDASSNLNMSPSWVGITFSSGSWLVFYNNMIDAFRLSKLAAEPCSYRILVTIRHSYTYSPSTPLTPTHPISWPCQLQRLENLP